MYTYISNSIECICVYIHICMHTYIFLKTLNLGMFNLTLHPLVHRKRGAVQSQLTSTVFTWNTSNVKRHLLETFQVSGHTAALVPMNRSSKIPWFSKVWALFLLLGMFLYFVDRTWSYCCPKCFASVLKQDKT